jgi:Uri superfamily endonuclease
VFEKMMDTKGYYEYIEGCMGRVKEKVVKELERKDKERDMHVQVIKDNIAKVEERYN